MFSWANTDNLLLQSLFTKPPFLHQSDQNVDDHGLQFFSNYPSPFIDEHELPLNQILPRGLLVAGAGDRSTSADQTMSNTSVSNKEKESKEKLALANGGASKLKQKADDKPSRRRSRLAVVPRKRTGKKDRHSKISTAQGIRDRRMRLSLHVARKFFDLQDVLGYDKASKTIEWLFSKSKTAIEELILDGENTNFSITTEAKSESFASENEEVSGIEETSNNEMRVAVRDARKTQNIACKTDVRDSREKARARARCRTAEKMINKHQWSVSSPNQIDLQKLGCCSNSPFEGIEHQQLGDVGTIEKLLENVGSSNFCHNNNFTYYNLFTSASDSSFMGILENWSLLNNDRHLGVKDQDSVYSASTSNLPLFP